MTAANIVAGTTAGRSAAPLGLPARYRVEGRLGSGANGETFAAIDTATGEARVVKLFGPGAGGRGSALAELRGLETLVHPNLARLRDVGRTADGRLYLVTDRVAGPGLEVVATVADDGARRALFARIARGLASALAHLHGRGVIHGDVAPSNVRLSSSASDAQAVLLDFGLAGPPLPAGAGGARGTLGYAAPEALTGARTPATDLFGLGATLFEAWTGMPPFGHGLEAAARVLAALAPVLSTIRGGLGAAWDTLIARLLSVDPAGRPASARLTLRDVLRIDGGADATESDLAVPYPDGDPLAGIFVGRRTERADVRAALERLAEGAATSSALALVGAPGSGRRTLFEVAARDAAVAAAAGTAAPIEIWRGGVAALGELVGPVESSPGDDPRRALEVRQAALAEALELRAHQRPICLLLDEDPASEALASFVAGAAPSGRTLVVLPTAAPIRRPFAAQVIIPPLTAVDLAALVAAGVDQPPPPGAIEAVARASGGNAAVASVLARRLIAELRAGGSEVQVVGEGGDLAGLLARGFASLPAETRRWLLGLALVGADAATPAQLDAGAASHAARAAGAAGWLVTDAAGSPRLPSAAHRVAVLDGVSPAEGAEVGARALKMLAPGAPALADALAVSGRREQAASVLRRDASVVGADPAQVVASFARAERLAPGTADFAERLAFATGLGALGRYADAAEVLAGARAAAQTAEEMAAACERDGWLRARRGDLDGAREVLLRGLGASESSDSPSAKGSAKRLRARLGRLLVTAGRFAEAAEIVAPLLVGGARSDDRLVAGLAVETALLSRAYLGDLVEARRWLGELGPLTGETRRAYLDGLLAQLAGDEEAARDAYRRAYQLAAAGHDIHTVAAVALNLSGLLIEEGLYGEALAASARAVRELGRLGAQAELGPALVNAANLFVEVGDLEAAQRALGRLGDLARETGAGRASATAAFVEGDLARRRGRTAEAAAHYARSAELFGEAASTAGAASALLALAETESAAGRPDDAQRALGDAERLLAPNTTAHDPELWRTRAVLALGDGRVAAPLDQLAARLERLAHAARAAARRPRAWRLAVLASRLYTRAELPPAAAAALDFARRTHQEIRMATPEHHRSALDADPDATWLATERPGSTGGNPTAARAQAAEEARMRRLLRINKRLNSELRLPRLLEMILDTVIELTDAERGFLLLEDDSGELAIKVARNIDQRSLETDELALSRSIARQAAVGGEPVVTIDAAGDDRFREALSVSDLHLRSVLAVPLSIKGKVAGTIYVDHRLRKGAFGEDDVRLVLDFAEQAAIALENARLLGELRRRERQVDALNRRLETELAARREELSSIKVELHENREALAVRYDYRNIVGRTPRMLELFRLIDRITDTTLPVVIQGESGTGKELVARALHANGPRRERAFVGENCAAIPETLLESTLFGYVRGAFTGADHDTRGLFEVADGGTLFLDEIGEMSPAMQGKLLRVLQEGEIRRVGSERTRKVDVRIVAATNRDLARMVEEGKFRRDLYFRLNVAAIGLPPLRERRDDIPLMVDHFLTKAAARAGRPSPKPIEPAALARLCTYRWPGNVRELENELTRADALSGPRIVASDLSPRVGDAAETGILGTEELDSLMLKPRVERLERALLREALGRAGNNQTKAAELLGLSRFGLQKKLKRYNFVS